MMKWYKRKITQEQYERALKNAGYIAEDDMKTVFTDSERLGYGVYSPCVRKEDDGYYVHFELGSTCD